MSTTPPRLVLNGLGKKLTEVWTLNSSNMFQPDLKFEQKQLKNIMLVRMNNFLSPLPTDGFEEYLIKTVRL